MKRTLMCVVTVGASALAAAPSQALPSSADGPAAMLRVEYFPDGGVGAHTLAPGTSNIPKTERTPARAAAGDGEVETIAVTGTTAQRLDVTILGDGYTASQQDALSRDARAAWATFHSYEPYRSYAGLANVRIVHTVSAQSGISGDPDPGTVRNTALGSSFWCQDIERLLCTDLDRVKTYAANSPASDLVLVVANSTKYGGAGYQDLAAAGYPFAGVATLAGRNSAAPLIAVHEAAHALGRLADEYDYGDGSTWTGGEIPYPNVTNKTVNQIAATKTKWYRWLGAADPAGGRVGAVEGAYYVTYGAYRPTNDSLMRSLGARQFNLPSREALIRGFYRFGDALTARTSTAAIQPRGARLTVTTAAQVSGLSRVQVRWSVDGREKPAFRGRLSVRPVDLGVPSDGRVHQVMASAVDLTVSIRDPRIRTVATNSATWRVRG